MLSSLFANGDRLEEALELCGRGLLVRVKLLGPHEKTAESHFHLGLLYFRQEIFQEALKELIQGNIGLPVADLLFRKLLSSFGCSCAQRAVYTRKSQHRPLYLFRIVIWLLDK